MTEPVKAKAVKPVKAWACLVDGKIDPQTIYKRRDEVLYWHGNDAYYSNPIRVEIREVK